MRPFCRAALLVCGRFSPRPFWSAAVLIVHHLRNLGTTHDDHLRLIGKRVVDFLLALIELFSLGVTAEEL